MQKLSVVIVCKNEEDIIGETIRSFEGLTDDILIYDNGSTDNTQKVVSQFSARFITGPWEGFGKTKNTANRLAKYDWVLSLDADEAIDEELKNNLLHLELKDEPVAYQLRFKIFWGKKWMRFGEWGGDRHVRLFHRGQVKWNDALVHETLLIPKETRIVRVPGFILHKTVKSNAHYAEKMKKYAAMNAEKYFREGKKPSGIQKYFSASFSFFRNYVLRLGFLDGREGFTCARMTAGYTFMKYKKLQELNRRKEVDG
jgi:glycosyltransferase involved in cell wall biosynthesis